MWEQIVKNKRLEWVCWGLCVLALLFAMLARRPWFDEAQAWQIAKTASIYDIVFTIPHYEGHPPLWHLVLVPFAKTGIPWQLGLRFVGLLCSAWAFFLLIFKAPFARWIRLVLPFTYFLFYQYGAIIRPYGIFFLLMLLLAIVFPKKDQSPGIFVFLLAALCAIHAYGIAVAGGIALAWMWDIKQTVTFKQYFQLILHDKRFTWLGGLLIWAGCIIWITYPAFDAFAKHLICNTPHWKQLLYLVFVLPLDATLLNVWNNDEVMCNIALQTSSFWWMVPLGCGMWTIFFSCLPKKKLLYFVLPFGLLLSVMKIYSSNHHIGILAFICIFFAWISLQADRSFSPKPFVKKIGILALAFSCIVSIRWSAVNLYLDIKYPAFPGKELVSFLKKHQLMQLNTFTSWMILNEAQGLFGEDTNIPRYAMEITFYANQNFITNFNHGSSRAYVLHRRSTVPMNRDTLIQWQKKGIPDVLLGDVPLHHIFPNGKMLKRQFAPVYIVRMYVLWKDNKPNPFTIPVLVRKDLLNSHHLTPISVK